MIKLLALIPAALMLLAAAPPPADKAALDDAVQAIYRHFRHTHHTRSAWQYPGWSAETAALIAHWRRVTPTDEVDDLSDSDWFCQCQDWDSKAFTASVRRASVGPATLANVSVRFTLDSTTARNARLVFRKQDGRWKLDDLFAQGFPRGLKQALRETIAADERLRK